MRGPLLFEWLEASCEVGSWTFRVMHTVGTVVHQGGGYYIVSMENAQLTAVPVSCLTRPPRDVSTDSEADSRSDPDGDRPGDDSTGWIQAGSVEGLGGVGTLPFGGYSSGGMGSTGGCVALPLDIDKYPCDCPCHTTEGYYHCVPCCYPPTAESEIESRALRKAYSHGR